MTLDDVLRQQDLLFQTLGIDRPGYHHLCCFHEQRPPGSMSVFQDEQGVWRYKCWACDAKGTVVDATMHFERCSFKDAIHRLGVSTNGSRPLDETAYKQKVHRYQYKKPKTVRPVPNQRLIHEHVEECHERLLSSRETLAYLRKRRGIDRQTAIRFLLGVQNVERSAGGQIARCEWVMPIGDVPEEPDAPGSILAIKIHREHPVARSGRRKPLKCNWLKFGTTPKDKPRHAFITLWPQPERFDPGEWLFIHGGELKALAMISCGFCATSCTGAESYHWNQETLKRLRGRRVIYVYDDDEPKKKPDGTTFFPGLESASYLETALKPHVRTYHKVTCTELAQIIEGPRYG